MNRQYDNTNKGVLFKNDDKQSETHPDYKGTINVGGQEFWLSCWLNSSRDGKKYMSLSVKPKEARQGQRQAQRREDSPHQSKPDDFDDDSDIPF